jgi:hypothetical protein
VRPACDVSPRARVFTLSNSARSVTGIYLGLHVDPEPSCKYTGHIHFIIFQLSAGFIIDQGHHITLPSHFSQPRPWLSPRHAVSLHRLAPRSAHIARYSESDEHFKDDPEDDAKDDIDGAGGSSWTSGRASPKSSKVACLVKERGGRRGDLTGK